jgi:NADPH2:quinone reductase
VKVIRLVRSEASATKLAETLPGSPAVATQVAGWKERVSAAAQGVKIHVAIDSVGGRLLGAVADLLAERTGTMINFGSLGGETSDIRLFPPRLLTLKGVVHGGWLQEPPDQRRAQYCACAAARPGSMPVRGRRTVSASPDRAGRCACRSTGPTLSDRFY